MNNCCNKNVAVIVLTLILVKIMLIVEMFRLWTISGNEHFAEYYFGVYLTLVILIAVVTVLLVLLIFEQPQTQVKYLKWLILSLSILFFLIALWVVIYVFYIYDKDDEYVYVNGHDKKNMNEDKESGYTDADGRYHPDQP